MIKELLKKNDLISKIKTHYRWFLIGIACVIYWITTTFVETLFMMTPLGLLMGFGWMLIKKLGGN